MAYLHLFFSNNSHMQRVGADVLHRSSENEEVYVKSFVLHFSVSIQSVQNTHKMDTEDIHDGPVSILPRKRLKTIDWTKCVICQRLKRADLRKGGADGITTFVAAARYRLDDTEKQLRDHLDHLRDNDVMWHRMCFQTYTSTQHFKSVSGEKYDTSSKPNDDTTTVVSILRSSKSPTNWS